MEHTESPHQEDNVKQVPLQPFIQATLNSDQIPHLYANGFIAALGNGDVVIILQRNVAPTAVINISYTVAKTLAQKLGNLIENFETNASHVIMTTEIVDKALAKQAGKNE